MALVEERLLMSDAWAVEIHYWSSDFGSFAVKER
jgi:hypothetical protein